MNTGNWKRWIAPGLAPLIGLILIFSLVDLTPWLTPEKQNKLPESKTQPAFENKAELQSPAPQNRSIPLKINPKFHFTQAEGYTEPEKLISYKEHGDFPEYSYSVLVGSFRNQITADRIMAGYRNKGYSAYEVKKELKNKGTWFRVLVGYFESIEEAREFILSEHLEDAVPVKTKYANLIGTFPSQEAVREKIQRLSGLGYTPYLIQNSRGECRLYIGAFENRREAEAQAAMLASSGISCRPVRR
ncbi:MAG: SPOR domain-containing protein [Thermodesulfobacteriota bacterium]